MNGICAFLNTRVLNNTGHFSTAGNALLTPVRYLFNGSNVAVTNDSRVHHVASFHKRGIQHVSKTNQSMPSARKGMMRTAIAILCLIPGLLFGSVLKGIGYASNKRAKKAQEAVKLHFTPFTTLNLGVKNPIETEDRLRKMCAGIRLRNTFNRSSDTIYIRASENLRITEDPGLLAFNPKKIIVEGGSLELADKKPNFLLNKIYLKNWKVDDSAATVDEARAKVADRRSWYSLERCHTLFRIPQPQQGN